MSLKSMECFLQAVEDMNFTVAAGKMYITQQTFSQHIKRLESDYNVPLFVRRPSLRLTQEGEIMAEYARLILRLEREMSARMAEINSHASGTLSLGLSRMRARFFFPLLWPEYDKLFSNIRLQLVHGESEELESGVRSHKIDMCLTVNSPEISSMVSRNLLSETMRAVVARRLFRSHFASDWRERLRRFTLGVSPADFIGLPTIASGTNRLRRVVDAAFEAARVVPDVFFISKEHELQFRMAEAGRGTAYLSPVYLLGALKNNPDFLCNVYTFPMKNVNLTDKLLYLKNQKMPIYQKEFIALCERIFGAVGRALDKMAAALRTQNFAEAESGE